jgi:uncharacterized protein with FMN-binding domain
MPKRAMVATFLTTVALALLLSFKTPDTSGLSAPAAAQSGATSGTRSAYSGQLTGTGVQTPFGTVQVQVTLQSGQITDVQALQLPAGGHSGQVSSYAEPQLRSEVLQAQSAQVNTISGATYTSMGYIQSVQSALDQAGLGQSGLAAAQATPTTGAVNGAGTDSAGQATAAPAQGAAATPATGTGSGTKSSYTGQLTGAAIQIPYGTVQVQVTMSKGKITDVQTLQLPGGGRSSQISRYAAPQLRSEVLQAQSAQVNTISGATYTSMAYQQSLQAALDQAAA